MDEGLGIMGVLLRELLRLAGVTLCSDVIRCDSQEANRVCVYTCVCVFVVVLSLFYVLVFFCLYLQFGNQASIRVHTFHICLSCVPPSPRHLPIIFLGNTILVSTLVLGLH